MSAHQAMNTSLAGFLLGAGIFDPGREPLGQWVAVRRAAGGRSSDETSGTWAPRRTGSRPFDHLAVYRDHPVCLADLGMVSSASSPHRSRFKGTVLAVNSPRSPCSPAASARPSPPRSPEDGISAGSSHSADSPPSPPAARAAACHCTLASLGFARVRGLQADADQVEIIRWLKTETQDEWSGRGQTADLPLFRECDFRRSDKLTTCTVPFACLQCLVTMDLGSREASPSSARSDRADAISASRPSTVCR